MVAGLPPVDGSHESSAALLTAADPPPDHPTAVRSLPFKTSLLVLLALLGWSLSFNLVVLQKLPGISPIDGIVYSDAFDRALQGSITVQGDRMGEETTRYIGCRGVQGFGSMEIPCEGPYPETFRGFTSAYVHPPTYFFATATLVKAGQYVFPDVYVFDLARIVSGVWFALGAFVMVVLAARWGARPWPAALVVAALLPTPTFMSMFAFITPDSMSLLVCASIALGATLWWQNRIPAWSLVFFGALAALVKQTYLLAVIAAVLLIGLLWLLQRRRSGRHTLQAAGFLCLGAAAAVVGWDLLKRSLALFPLPDSGSDPFAYPVTFDGAVGLLFQGAHDLPVDAAGLLIAVPLASRAIGSAAVLALAAAAGGALLYQARKTDEFALSAAGVIAVVTGGLILSGLYFASSGIFLPPAPRYVMGAFPIYALPLVLAMRSRLMVGLVAALALVGYVAWLLTPIVSVA